MLAVGKDPHKPVLEAEEEISLNKSKSRVKLLKRTKKD